MTYKEAELLNARFKRAAADCIIDAINLDMHYVDNYRAGGESSWDVPF